MIADNSISGRTFEELDLLFAKHVPARQFRRYNVDAYASGEDVLVAKE
jgi:MFS transporter, SP family, general alpha glucoside:H+ symporter